MCTPGHIRAHMLIISIIKTFQIIYFFLLGLILTIDIHLHQAFDANKTDNMLSFWNDHHDHYSMKVKNIGISFLIITFMSIFNIFIGIKGTQLHNKILLLIHFTIEFILFCIQMSLGLSLKKASAPIYPLNLRLDCMLTEPKVTPLSKCQEYWNHKRTQRFRTLWADYFERATQYDRTKSKYYKRIMDVQERRQCCGFYPPLQCDSKFGRRTHPRDEDSSGYDDDQLLLNSEEVVSLEWCPMEHWIECSWMQPFYLYPDNIDEVCHYDMDDNFVWSNNNNNNTMSSSSLYDTSTNETSCLHHETDSNLSYRSKCPFDLPLGNCKSKQTHSNTSGCAAVFEEQIHESLTVPIDVALVSCSFQIFAILISCCYFWKRKREDVLPRLENFR